MASKPAPASVRIRFPDPSKDPARTEQGWRRGRGSRRNVDNRYSALARESFDDGWLHDDDTLPPLATTLIEDKASTVIARNTSPDVPFSQSINPYRGCEHGCAYCFARPTHAWLGLSPGLDFETRLAWKADAAERLREELARPHYQCSPIALGINTDAYQPVERKLELTRRLIEVLRETRHPFSIVTKSALIERDLDLLAGMGRAGLVQVMFSITSLDRELARRLEPRAAQPQRRLEAMRRVAAAGVPCGVLFAPVIPAINDHEMEAVLAASRDAGAETAGYVPLRLPLEVAPLFQDWLDLHAPGRAAHVMSVVGKMHGGKAYDSRFGVRMRGTGPFADLLAKRFELACRRLGFNQTRRRLDCTQFVPPQAPSPQGRLF